MAKQTALIEALLTIPPTSHRRKLTVKAAKTGKDGKAGASKARTQAVTANDNEIDRLRQIYYVAARLFCERGFDATSMNDIADAIGFTKAAVYHFIPGGKKELLYAVISYGMDTLEREVLAPARAVADPEQRLRTIIQNHVQVITRGSTAAGFNPVTVVVDEVAGLSPVHRRKIAQRKRAYVDLVRDTLRALKVEGKLKEIDITVIAFSIFGMMLWLARWYRPDGPLTNTQVAEEICKMALSGLLQTEPR
ncbi:MAG: TetR/AcrR family transcriptional regulator [Acidobacteria bacterium]|nr:TetR/AcrR family transcriptional regulator [Acidobacteriota bacterium]MBI3425681.1 TetR/AcrR family transcriptional regulator [Acidobacteriota bacterium]